MTNISSLLAYAPSLIVALTFLLLARGSPAFRPSLVKARIRKEPR